MENEIKEEPEIVITENIKNYVNIQRLYSKIKNSEFIYLTGSGTSFHAAMFMNIILLKNGFKSVAIQSSEFYDDIANKSKKNYINIIFSQSGESIDALNVLNISKKNNIYVIGITNEKNSTLYKESDLSIVTNAKNEISIAATKSHTVQLVISLLLDSIINNYDASESINELYNKLKNVINNFEEIKIISEKIKNNVVFLGSYFNYPVALEAELKFKETSGINSEAYATREYLHGPFHRINNNTSVILIKGNEKYDADLLKKIKDTGCNIITAGDKNSDINISENNNIISAILYTTVIQAMANFKALSLGYDPDKPSNLTKIVK